MIGSAVHSIVLDVLAIGAGNRACPLFDGCQMALSPIWVLQGVDDGNHLIQDRCRAVVGSRYQLIRKLHGRIGARKFISVDAVCHDGRGRVGLDESPSCRSILKFSRVSEFSVAGLDLIQSLMVFRAGNKQVDQRSTFVGLAVGIQCDAV